jgi:hypothetical protein
VAIASRPRPAGARNLRRTHRRFTSDELGNQG